jgi:hypothetical protein
MFKWLLILCILISAIYLDIKQNNLEKRLNNIEMLFRKQVTITKQDTIPPVYKALIDDFIQQNIEEIVNEPHLAGGKWIVTNQVYLSANTILIDYEDGHEAGQLIMVIDIQNNKIEYRVLWKLS